MKKLIQICQLFQGISEKDLEKIEESLILHQFRIKEHILREGNDNNNLYIIRTGVVRVDTYYNHKKRTLCFLKEGDFFGEIAVFTGRVVSANVVSTINSEIFILKKEALYNLIIEIPKLAENIIHYLGNRVRSADQIICDYAFKMLEARIASKLINLMHMFRGKDEKNVFINLPITHQDIADFVGTSRETVTKILSKFKDKGLIDIKTKKITIIDEQRLETWGD